MQIYNTMSRSKEELVPQTPGIITMYACGPTVYNFFHIGNARPFIVFDTMRRYLEYIGYQVTYVQNFTDIDDKMIRRANEEGISVKELAERFIAEYYKDADSLGVRRATVNPRATEHIGEIVGIVETLVKKGHAYPTPSGDVYFSVRSFPGYGKLSGQPVEALESGARIDPSEEKRDPLDFALWKAEKPGEPSWDSPWGKGRPGWHIECSAMSMSLLGKTFDIHAGGQDLIFPHHENEIAQSEAATGQPFARYWMHNGYININNQKMSKSLNNFFTVRDIAEKFDLEAVRLFLLSAQYRNPVNFSAELLEQATSGLERLRTARERLTDALCAAGEQTPEDAAFGKRVEEFVQGFRVAMDDDLNTADALGVLFEFARALNTFVSESRGKAILESTLKRWNELTDVLGVCVAAKEEEFPKEALNLLEERIMARESRDWAKADALRDKLRELGFAVEDSKAGAKLKRI